MHLSSAFAMLTALVVLTTTPPASAQGFKFEQHNTGPTAEDIAKENPEVIKISRLGSQRIYEISPPGEKMAFATLIDGKILLATMSKVGLTDILGRRVSSKEGGLKKEFAVLLDTVNNQQSISFLATGGSS